MIDGEGWKQIATYSLTQLILLFVVIFLGPLFIPEKADNVDLIIGEDWMAKYADAQRKIICSGLPFSFEGSQWRYEEVFSKYNIFSRHQTIIFTLFSTMQIFNYFNFRQFNIKEVNIFKNFKLGSFIILILILLVNIFFVQNIGGYFGLYTNGLTFEQWIICVGVSMVIWVVGILTRLFPNIKKE